MSHSKQSVHIVAAALASAILGFTTSALADPVAYRGTVVTDVRLGQQTYHFASLKLTFVGDTNNIFVVTDSSGNIVPSANCNGTGNFFFMTIGSASFSFQSAAKSVSGHFLPGQIFVGLDVCNGGIGFGSFTGPHGLEPGYPLVFTHGSAEYLSFSSAVSLPTSPLLNAANTTGNAWSCIGYPPAFPSGSSGSCTPPDSYPLHTDLGEDFFIYMPYRYLCGTGDDVTVCSNRTGSMNRGTFSVIPGFSE